MPRNVLISCLYGLVPGTQMFTEIFKNNFWKTLVLLVEATVCQLLIFATNRVFRFQQISNDTAKTQMAILAFLYCGAFVETSNEKVFRARPLFLRNGIKYPSLLHEQFEDQEW